MAETVMGVITTSYSHIKLKGCPGQPIPPHKELWKGLNLWGKNMEVYKNQPFFYIADLQDVNDRK